MAYAAWQLRNRSTRLASFDAKCAASSPRKGQKTAEQSKCPQFLPHDEPNVPTYQSRSRDHRLRILLLPSLAALSFGIALQLVEIIFATKVPPIRRHERCPEAAAEKAKSKAGQTVVHAKKFHRQRLRQALLRTQKLRYCNHSRVLGSGRSHGSQGLQEESRSSINAPHSRPSFAVLHSECYPLTNKRTGDIEKYLPTCRCPRLWINGWPQAECSAFRGQVPNVGARKSQAGENATCQVHKFALAFSARARNCCNSSIDTS